MVWRCACDLDIIQINFYHIFCILNLFFFFFFFFFFLHWNLSKCTVGTCWLFGGCFKRGGNKNSLNFWVSQYPDRWRHCANQRQTGIGISIKQHKISESDLPIIYYFGKELQTHFFLLALFKKNVKANFLKTRPLFSVVLYPWVNKIRYRVFSIQFCL